MGKESRKLFSFRQKKLIESKLEDLYRRGFELCNDMYAIQKEFEDLFGEDIERYPVCSLDIYVELRGGPILSLKPNFKANGPISKLANALFIPSFNPHFTTREKVDKGEYEVGFSSFSISGGIESFYHAAKELLEEHSIDYYNPEYRRLRHEVMLEQGESCQKCGAKASPSVHMQVDHIKPVSKYPDLFLEKDNMQVLCAPCNMAKSNRHETDYRRKGK